MSKFVFIVFVVFIVGNFNDVIIKIVGGDYVIVLNFDFCENSFNIIIVVVLNNMMEWGIVIFYVFVIDNF